MISYQQATLPGWIEPPHVQMLERVETMVGKYCKYDSNIFG